MDSPRSILIVRPSALGDVCRSVPVLVSLRRAFPDATIDWLVQDTFAEAIASHPGLLPGSVVPFPRKRFAAWYNPVAMTSLAVWLKRLRAGEGRGYDVAIDAQGLLRSAAFTWASGAPIRIGHADAREGATRFYTHRVDTPSTLHAVDRMLRLLTPLSVQPVRDMRLFPPSSDRESVEREFAFKDGRYAVFAPTSRWPSKVWSDDRYASLAQRMLAEHTVDRVVIVGGPGEALQCPELVRIAEQDHRVINLIGKTRIGRLMAVIERAAVLIGSDSAAVHMAVGLGTRCVALYGPTDVRLVGPALGPPAVSVLQHVLPGEPVDHKSREPGATQMRRISVDEVLDLVR